MYKPIDDEIFHVHTYRCGHASEHSDEDYVIKAIELGAKRIVFTDHAPFPGDPFGSRMKMDEYEGYIDSVNSLKDKYHDQIEVLCGLEIEFFPQYMDYYKSLNDSEAIDVMILGQHMFRHEDGHYNFLDKDRSDEFYGISLAVLDAVETGFFDVIAHPDRMFSRYGKWDASTQNAADAIIAAAKSHNVFLERNYSSIYREKNFVKEFWNNSIDSSMIIDGYDAHSADHLDLLWNSINLGKINA